MVGAVVAVVAVGAVAYAASELSNSGRGLETDEWEMNQSLWMDQLEKDFENSWSVE